MCTVSLWELEYTGGKKLSSELAITCIFTSSFKCFTALSGEDFLNKSACILRRSQNIEPWKPGDPSLLQSLTQFDKFKSATQPLLLDAQLSKRWCTAVWSVFKQNHVNPAASRSPSNQICFKTWFDFTMCCSVVLPCGVWATFPCHPPACYSLWKEKQNSSGAEQHIIRYRSISVNF